MKIICSDNFSRDYVDDVLVAENIQSEFMANIMLAALRSKLGGNTSASYFHKEADNYILFVGDKG